MGVYETTDTMLSYIYEKLNCNETVLSIFYDLKKAFDSIDRSIPFCELEGAGVKGLCLDLLRNYLSGRTQRYKVNGVLSDHLPISCGVPQGSTLGPLLFIYYVNDVVNCIPTTCLSLYMQMIQFAIIVLRTYPI